MEFTSNLIMHYKNKDRDCPRDELMGGACENAIHELLQPWQEWAMETMGHDANDYSCEIFNDYEDCPYYPIFDGDKTMRVCSTCEFTNPKYDGVDDVAALINTTTLLWTQTHTIDGVRRVLHPSDEELNTCKCLGLKYKYMVDYYVSERGQRRRTRKYMRI